MRILWFATLLLGCGSGGGGGPAADGAPPDGPATGCGDGVCDGSETGCNCPEDCAPTCGDGCCTDAENACDCPIDCSGTCCGNGICEPSENTASCETDCPAPFCGDGLCGAPDEDCSNCLADCACSAVQACSGGACTSCANGICESGVVTPRVVLDVDVSGGMASAVCGFMEVDDTLECPGLDVPCVECNVPGCDNGLLDDSRLWKVKTAITGVVGAHPEVDFALARARMEPVIFSCDQGGWDGPGPICSNIPLGTGQNSADIVADFDESHASLLEWVDGQANYAGTPPPDACSLCPSCQGACDKELRADGVRPYAGSLTSIHAHLDELRTTDALSHCRPHAVVIVTSGGNSCRDPARPNDPDPTPEQAAALCAAGVPVYFVALGSVDLHMALDESAAAGCGSSCNATGCDGVLRVVDNETDLATEIDAIVAAQVATDCAEDATSCPEDCP